MDKTFLINHLKNSLRKYNIRKVLIGQGGDYTTGCLLDYNYFILLEVWKKLQKVKIQKLQEQKREE